LLGSKLTTLCALVARWWWPFALRAAEVVRALRTAAPHARRRTQLIATLIALRGALELTALATLVARRRGPIALRTAEVVRALRPVAAHARRWTLLIATLVALRWALELAIRVALTTRRTVVLCATYIIRALRATAHKRRRALLVAIGAAGRRAAEVAAIVCALMPAAHERRRTLAVAVLPALRRRTAELAALLALPARRRRRAVALHVTGIVRALMRFAHAGRWPLTLHVIGVVRAVVMAVHARRRALLVVAIIARLFATALMWRWGRRRAAGMLRGRIEGREAERQRCCCDDFFHDALSGCVECTAALTLTFQPDHPAARPAVRPGGRRDPFWADDGRPGPSRVPAA